MTIDVVSTPTPAFTYTENGLTLTFHDQSLGQQAVIGCLVMAITIWLQNPFTHT